MFYNLERREYLSGGHRAGWIKKNSTDALGGGMTKQGVQSNISGKESWKITNLSYSM